MTFRCRSLVAALTVIGLGAIPFVGGLGTGVAVASGPVGQIATATSSTSGPAPHRVARFYLRAPNGFKVTLIAAVEGAGSPVRIVAEDHSGSAEYQAPGTVTANKIRASFGPLGSVSLHFVPSGRVLRSTAQGGGCSLGAKAHLGTFVGTFHFRGEGGYTTLTTHRVKGGVGAPSAPINKHEQMEFGCPEASHTSVMAPSELERHFTESPIETTTPGRGVAAIATAQGEATAFAAWGFSIRHPEEEGASPDVCLFIAVKEETRGRVSIARKVLQGGPISQCPLDESTGSLSVAPEAPFTGTAIFQFNPDHSASWLGSLAVPMLGGGIVQLAGPEFQSKFVTK